MKIRNRNVGPGNPCYFIAEMSHNHQGCGNKALELVKQAAVAGADAVKFQKRNNKTLFHDDLYNAPYTTANSFGDSYGEHREFLEPKKDWLVEANLLAHVLGMDFIMTVFDVESLRFCEQNLQVDAYKIQSADLSFHLFVEAVAKTGKPYFISCGAASLEEIKEAYTLCSSLNVPFCMMYAVSSYPTSAEHINLSRISQLRETLGTKMIGFSCHNTCIEPAVYSRIAGSVAIEKHFTLDKTQKGPDHKLSLLPGEFSEMIEKIKAADIILGVPWTNKKTIEDYQLDARKKMGKSPVAVTDLDEGAVLKNEDVVYLSPANGISPSEITGFFGKKLNRQLKKGSYILPGNFV